MTELDGHFIVEKMIQDMRISFSGNRVSFSNEVGWTLVQRMYLNFRVEPQVFQERLHTTEPDSATLSTLLFSQATETWQECETPQLLVSSLEDGEEACGLIYGGEILKSGILFQSKYKVLTEMPKHVGECVCLGVGGLWHSTYANNCTNLLELNEKIKIVCTKEPKEKAITQIIQRSSQLLHTKERLIKNTFNRLRTQSLEDKRDIIHLGKQIEDQMNIIIE